MKGSLETMEYYGQLTQIYTWRVLRKLFEGDMFMTSYIWQAWRSSGIPNVFVGIDATALDTSNSHET